MLPGFTAEQATYRTRRSYASLNTGAHAPSSELVMQGYWCGDCYCGNNDMCVSNPTPHGLKCTCTPQGSNPHVHLSEFE